MLTNFFAQINEKPYRAQQIIKWIHERGVTDFSEMTDISKKLRQYLVDNCCITTPNIVSEHLASDETRKWLIAVPGGSLVETVFIPEEGRGTLCISSQVGCALNCSFCSTATTGFNRNLSSDEIIGQLFAATKRLNEVIDARLSTKITNVVMMGMGEPLLNFDNVKSALSIMRDEHGYALPRRRVTVSTSGVVPKIYDLIKEMDVSLAISLHAPNNELRSQLVPINKKHPIKELMDAAKEYGKLSPRHFVTMEYVMLKGVNDRMEHAKQLLKVLKDIKCKVNLIPFNPFPTAQYKCSSSNEIATFSSYLRRNGLVCTTRSTRGEDIDAACGQLVGKVKDKTKRSERYHKNFLAKNTEVTNEKIQ